MTLPNFFMVGAAKSGTTAVNEYLNQHPDIFMSPIKEPFHFILNGEPLDYNGPRDREILGRMATPNRARYEALFNGASKKHKAIGEATTQYLYVDHAAQAIHDAIPDAKILIMLRNPVDRAFSSWVHMLRDGRETYENFEDALSQEPARIAANWEPLWHYGSASYYTESVKRYYDLFGAEQVGVFLHDDLKLDAPKLLYQICQFLGVDDSFRPDTSTRYNVSGVPKNGMLHSIQTALLSPDNPVKAVVKPLLPKRLRHQALHSVVGKIREVNFEKRRLSPEMRVRLIARYRSDILRTQDLIDRDLSAWLRP